MIQELHQKLIAKELSAREIAESFLNRIAKNEGTLNAFITQTPELALAQANEVDKKITNGEAISLLAGIPCAI